MKGKFCFFASLALVGSISLTALNPQPVDASFAKTLQEGGEALTRGGAIAATGGFLEQNAPFVIGGVAAMTVGAIGVSVMKK